MDPTHPQTTEPERSTSSSDLGDTIRLLGNLLGEMIIEQTDQETFEVEEKIRQLSKAFRSGDPHARSAIDQLMPRLMNDLPLAHDILKAFTVYFQLVNLAEEHQRIRVLTNRKLAAQQQQTPMSESIEQAIQQLKEEELDHPQIQELLDTLSIRPVYTAHPTESNRRTTLLILKQITEQLQRLDDDRLLARERERIVELIRESIVLLWQCTTSRDRPPTVMDEVRNCGLYFLDQTVLELVPRVYQELEEALTKTFPDSEFNVSPFLEYGSWIGGDRDGNPHVTPQITEEALREQKDTALKRYERETYALYHLLGPSTRRVRVSDELTQSLIADFKLVPKHEHDVLDRFRSEPYRQKLILMFRRLSATRKENQRHWNEPLDDPRAYENAEQFLEDLQTIDRSLRGNRGERLADARLATILCMVKVFGFHLSVLDVRQHSQRHRNAVAEIFSQFGINEDYENTPEAERLALLRQEISSRRPLTARLSFSEQTNETIALFRLIKQAHERIGSDAVEDYVISMTRHASHILEVLLLARDADLMGKINIVPLLETVDDLLNAPRLLTELFEDPVYRQHLAQRHDRQQIMIGYSDSNKDGGYLRANWMQYQAQQSIAQVCQQYSIELTLFHGRGGSLGRGGGPANRAILAQPPESIRGRMKITEQGEVISKRYANPKIAHRHLEQLVNAVLLSAGKRPPDTHQPDWDRVMDDLSQRAFHKYRALVEHERFLRFFHEATPIDQIELLNIGSRPSRRRATQSIDDLRAIPWVFAWTQTRVNLPSWYGIGTAIHSWLHQDDDAESIDSRRNQLIQMYREWPFAHMLFRNVHVGLGKADMAIATAYAELTDPQTRDEIFGDIRREFELTCQAILQVTGHREILETEPWLQKSVRARNPYVDPIHYIQIALLKRLQDEPESAAVAEIQESISLSINGIAAGLQSVG